jgi:hypothetical protein
VKNRPLTELMWANAITVWNNIKRVYHSAAIDPALGDSATVSHRKQLLLSIHCRSDSPLSIGHPAQFTSHSSVRIEDQYRSLARIHHVQEAVLIEGHRDGLLDYLPSWAGTNELT